MRIAQVCSFDISGGASRAAYRLHRGLLDAGADSKMFVGAKASNDPSVVLVPPGRNVLRKIRRRARYGFTRRIISSHSVSIAAGHDVFSSDRIPGATRVADLLSGFDIIHLHWISWFIDLEDFFSNLPAAVPIVWTLHDMNTFTGGCHYDAGCGRYRNGCGICPALDSKSPGDLSSEIFARKSAIFDRMPAGRLHLIAPSRWLAETARGSRLLEKFKCMVIPNGLDTSVYKPVDRLACRKVLDISPDAKVVLFVADSTANKRKGFSLLREALALIKDIPGLLLLSIGPGPCDIAEGVAHVSVGQVQNDRFLAAIYSAADVMVVPSLQDNLPNTVIESMACGTPAIGFDIGGIPDMIQPGLTGFLAPARDVPGLAAAIRSALSDENRGRFSNACREQAVARYDLNLQARTCMELYQRALAGK